MILKIIAFWLFIACATAFFYILNDIMLKYAWYKEFAARVAYPFIKRRYRRLLKYQLKKDRIKTYTDFLIRDHWYKGTSTFHKLDLYMAANLLNDKWPWQKLKRKNK